MISLIVDCCTNREVRAVKSLETALQRWGAMGAQGSSCDNSVAGRSGKFLDCTRSSQIKRSQVLEVRSENLVKGRRYRM